MLLLHMYLTIMELLGPHKLIPLLYMDQALPEVYKLQLYIQEVFLSLVWEPNLIHTMVLLGLQLQI